jgi:hypothetical protein
VLQPKISTRLRSSRPKRAASFIFLTAYVHFVLGQKQQLGFGLKTMMVSMGSTLLVPLASFIFPSALK